MLGQTFPVWILKSIVHYAKKAFFFNASQKAFGEIKEDILGT